METQVVSQVAMPICRIDSLLVRCTIRIGSIVEEESAGANRSTSIDNELPHPRLSWRLSWASLFPQEPRTCASSPPSIRQSARWPSARPTRVAAALVSTLVHPRRHPRGPPRSICPEPGAQRRRGADPQKAERRDHSEGGSYTGRAWDEGGRVHCRRPVSGIVPDAALANVWTLKFSDGDRHFLAIGERRCFMAVWRVRSGCLRVTPIYVPSCFKFMVYAEIGEVRRSDLRAIAKDYERGVPPLHGSHVRHPELRRLGRAIDALSMQRGGATKQKKEKGE